MTEGQLRRVAKERGYILEKGFVHYFPGGFVFHNQYGNRYTGYELLDTETGYHHPDGYDSNFDHKLTLEDVERILAS